MTIDTLAYTKHLEQAGVERRQAEAFAEALHRFVVPDLATKADLTTLKHELIGVIHTTELRSLGVVAAMLSLAVAIIKLV
jgi:hypothetical protein